MDEDLTAAAGQPPPAPRGRRLLLRLLPFGHRAFAVWGRLSKHTRRDYGACACVCVCFMREFLFVCLLVCGLGRWVIKLQITYFCCFRANRCSPHLMFLEGNAGPFHVVSCPFPR